MSTDTGLASYVYGTLWPEQQGANHELAAQFLQTYQLAFSGTLGTLKLEHVRDLRWSDGTVQLTYRQINSLNVPVLSSRIVLTYDAGENLVLTTSSLHPATMDDLPVFTGLEPTRKELLAAVTDALEKHCAQYGCLPMKMTGAFHFKPGYYHFGG